MPGAARVRAAPSDRGWRRGSLWAYT